MAVLRPAGGGSFPMRNKPQAGNLLEINHCVGIKMREVFTDYFWCCTLESSIASNQKLTGGHAIPCRYAVNAPLHALSFTAFRSI